MSIIHQVGRVVKRFQDHLHTFYTVIFVLKIFNKHLTCATRPERSFSDRARAAEMGRPRLPAGPEPVDILEDVAVLRAFPSLGRMQPGDDLAELLLLAHLAQVALDGDVGGGEADAGTDLDGLHWGVLLALDVPIIPHARTLVKGAMQNFIQSSQSPFVGVELYSSTACPLVSR